MKLCYYLDNFLLKPKWSKEDELNTNNYLNLGSISWSTNVVTLFVNKYNHELLFEGESFIDKHPEFKKNNFDAHHLAILKSQIQKCVRRCKIDIGIKTAISMILIEENKKQTGLFELLRRLTIIIIEDSVLSESFGALMWLFAVLSKGHYLNAYSIEKILEITKGILSSGYRDPTAYSNNNNNNNKQIDNNQISELPINNSLMMSLLFRTSYKGMLGDQNMLFLAVKTWTNRISKKSKLLQYLSINSPVPIDKYEQLQKHELQPESLDFHCTNIADRIKKYIDFDKSEIENLIWNNMSSINERINIKTNKISINQECNKWKLMKFIYQMEAKNITYDL